MAKKKKLEKHVHSKTPRIKKVTIPNWHIPAILIITAIIYLPALGAGFVNWDDPDYVGENNILIRSLSNLPDLFSINNTVQGNYHPLTMTSLAINFAMSGDNAWSYHLFNLIFHLINCVLVYRFALLLSKNNTLIALVASLLFGIHPLHVESVAWVSERKDVLYALFFLLGHISFTKYVDTNSKKQYWFTLVFGVLSLLSKPAAVIFPVSLFCVDLLRQRKFSFKLITEKIPFFIPAIIIGLLTINAQKTVGATGEDYFGLGKNLLFGFYGIMMYVIKMIFPYKLSAFYPFPPLNEKLPVIYYVAPLFTLFLIAMAWFSWKRYRAITFGIAFYLVNLALVLQVFSVGSAVIAERYTYVPYIGLFFIAGWLLDRLTKGNIQKAYYILAPVTLIFAIVSFLQAQTWKDGATLWDSVIKNQPSSRAYSARATLFRKDANALLQESNLLLQEKRNQEATIRNNEANANFRKAIDYYSQAIKLNAIDHESYNNRANIYIDMGKLDSAFIDYNNALRVKPNYYVALDNIGGWYARKNMFDSALFYLNKVFEQKPDYKPTFTNRGLTLMSLNRYDEAIKDWQRALEYEPNAPDIINTIGLCYRMQGKFQDAVKYITQAIQISPQPAFFLNRSYAYTGLNDLEKARQDALKAKQAGINLEPSHAANLGIQ
jgi:tetratricopeptide (TPR) repeat protein